MLDRSRIVAGSLSDRSWIDLGSILDLPFYGWLHTEDFILIENLHNDQIQTDISSHFSSVLRVQVSADAMIPMDGAATIRGSPSRVPDRLVAALPHFHVIVAAIGREPIFFQFVRPPNADFRLIRFILSYIRSRFP